MVWQIMIIQLCHFLYLLKFADKIDHSSVGYQFIYFLTFMDSRWMAVPSAGTQSESVPSSCTSPNPFKKLTKDQKIYSFTGDP